MLDLLIAWVLDYSFSGITVGSYDILKKALKNFYRKQVLKRMLLRGFYSAVDEIKKQHHNRDVLESLDIIKKTFLNTSPRITKLLKSPDISPKMRNDLFYEHCRNVFDNVTLPEEVQNQLITRILNVCSDALKEMLYNYSDEFQKEVISILEKSRQDDKEFAAVLSRIISILNDQKVNTDELSKRLNETEAAILRATFNPHDNNLEQLNACRKTRGFDALKILCSIEEVNEELANENFFEMHYFQEYRQFIPQAIQSEIRCGNIKSRQLFENLSNIKRTGKTTDLIYWIGDVLHLLDNYSLAERILSDQENMKEGYISDIYDIQLLQAHILTHKNQLEPSKKIFVSLLHQDLSVKQKVECLFRIGEIEVFQGYSNEAIETFCRSNRLISNNREANLSREDKARLDRFEADNFRKMGTAYLMLNNLNAAKKQYEISEDIYSRAGARGKIWLLHGIAEYARIAGNLDLAIQKYGMAETASHRALNINRVAHSYLGRAEVLRMQGSPVFKIYEDCFSIYQDIHSDWGLANTHISRGLAYLVTHNDDRGWADIDKAKAICLKMGLQFEQQVIDHIIDEDPKDVLHPLSFF